MRVSAWRSIGVAKIENFPQQRCQPAGDIQQIVPAQAPVPSPPSIGVSSPHARPAMAVVQQARYRLIARHQRRAFRRWSQAPAGTRAGLPAMYALKPPPR